MALNINKLSKPSKIGAEDTRLKGIGFDNLSVEKAAELRERVASNQETKASVPAEIEKKPEINVSFEGYDYKKVPVQTLIDAPAEWNFFTVPSENKLIDLAISIYNNGLLQPIVVRSTGSEETPYQILAGHTRVSAYRLLYKLFNDEKYLEIEAIIFDKDKLNDTKAREIIIDTNMMQRGNLSYSDTVKCVSEKVKLLKEQGISNIIDVISKDYDIKKTSIYMFTKLDKLIEPFKELMDAKKITLRNAEKLAGFSAEDQELIYVELDGLLTKGIFSLLKKNMSAADFIAAAKANTKVTMKTVQFSYQADSEKSDKDLHALVMVTPEALSKFKELLEGFDGAYMIDYK